MNHLRNLRLAGLPCLAAAFALLVCCGAPPWAVPPLKPLASFDSQVRPLVAQMTLDEKVGQMTQPNQGDIKDLSDIENLMVGSVLSGGDSDPEEGNTLQNWTDLYERIQRRTERTRLKIPLLYGIDAVHGHNNVLGAVIFPHNIGLGCTRNAALVQLVARVTAEEVRATGIQWAFAPCIAVPQDIRWGRTYEGFSEDPRVVRTLGSAAVWGLQGKDLADPLAVLACAKHYVGDGGTAYGSGTQGAKLLDQGDTQVDEATLRRIHLPGYIAAIENGVGSIMPSYSSWNGVKCSASKRLLTEILKQELGFQGFLISDYSAIDQIDPDYKKSVGISINAGMDMAMVPDRYREFIADLKALVAEGVVPMSRIDDAVTRILRVKFAMGLMDPGRSQLADRSLQKSFGSPAAPAGGPRRRAPVAGPAQEPEPRLADGEEPGAHPRRRKERGRPGQSVRRMDHLLAGQQRQRDAGRHHRARGHPESRLQGHYRHLFKGWNRSRGSHCGRGGDWRAAICRNQGRPHRIEPGP